MATDMEKLVKDWFAAFNSHDAEKISRFYTDDCLFESAYLGGSVDHGKNEMIAALKAEFINIPDFKIEQKATFYSENGVCGEVIISGTQAHSSNPAVPATGKRFSVRGAYVSEWQKGKVKRHVYYQDMLTVMQQLGLMPAPAKK